MLEREFMKKWVAERLKAAPGSYWLRIPDSADGIKPFDGILWMPTGMSIAVEFKVWRYAGPFDGSTVEAHQMKALLDFKGYGRRAWIVVYYQRTEEVRKFAPTQRALERILGKAK